MCYSIANRVVSGGHQPIPDPRLPPGLHRGAEDPGVAGRDRHSAISADNHRVKVLESLAKCLPLELPGHGDPPAARLQEVRPGLRHPLPLLRLHGVQDHRPNLLLKLREAQAQGQEEGTVDHV